MPIPNYGVLIGTIIDKLDSTEAVKKNPGSSPHYQILVEANNVKFRVAVNVKSDQKPSDLQFLLDDNYKHPVLQRLITFSAGFTKLASQPDTGALDYIRGNLFDIKKMQIVPSVNDGDNNDLNDIFDVYVQKAINTKGALIYAFGSRWNTENNKSDEYFGFKPGNGVHDIHMNQGNSGSHKMDNGIYQDGGLMLFYPDEQKWVAMFLKFQSQAEHTDDVHGNPVGDKEGTSAKVAIKIFATMVNPSQENAGKEFVYLVNATDSDVDLDGWMIANEMKKKEKIRNVVLEASGVAKIILSAENAQLSKNGGIITLLNKEGIKIDGVSYTRDEVGGNGTLVTF